MLNLRLLFCAPIKLLLSYDGQKDGRPQISGEIAPFFLSTFAWFNLTIVVPSGHDRDPNWTCGRVASFNKTSQNYCGQLMYLEEGRVDLLMMPWMMDLPYIRFNHGPVLGGTSSSIMTLYNTTYTHLDVLEAMAVFDFRTWFQLILSVIMIGCVYCGFCYRRITVIDGIWSGFRTAIGQHRFPNFVAEPKLLTVMFVVSFSFLLQYFANNIRANQVSPTSTARIENFEDLLSHPVIRPVWYYNSAVASSYPSTIELYQRIWWRTMFTSEDGQVEDQLKSPMTIVNMMLYERRALIGVDMIRYTISALFHELKSKRRLTEKLYTTNEQLSPAMMAYAYNRHMPWRLRESVSRLHQTMFDMGILSEIMRKVAQLGIVLGKQYMYSGEFEDTVTSTEADPTLDMPLKAIALNNMISLIVALLRSLIVGGVFLAGEMLMAIRVSKRKNSRRHWWRWCWSWRRKYRQRLMLKRQRRQRRQKFQQVQKVKLFNLFD